jgi:hypothetical protein
MDIYRRFALIVIIFPYLVSLDFVTIDYIAGIMVQLKLIYAYDTRYVVTSSIY